MTSLQAASSRRSQPIFVLGSHRGGTTFVQRLLNCHRRVTIWGENGGLVTAFREAYERFDQSPATTVDARRYRRFDAFADQFTPWASPFTRDELAGRIRDLLESLHADPADPGGLWGFKEIRHGNVCDLRFLARLFPGCRLVLLVRHPKRLLLSQLFARWGGRHFAGPPDAAVRTAIAAYAGAVEAYLDAVECRPALARILTYESIAAGTVADDLFGFLDLWDVDLDRRLVDVVLGTRVGSSFGDVGRDVSREQQRDVRAAYDDHVDRTLAEAATPRALEAIRGWYPGLRDEGAPHD